MYKNHKHSSSPPRAARPKAPPTVLPFSHVAPVFIFVVLLLTRARMGRHEAEGIPPKEREDNATAQAEELEAVEAIYGDSCCDVQRSTASAAPEV